MELPVHNSNSRLFSAGLAAVTVVVVGVAVGLFAATPAWAGYELVQTFAGTPGVLKPLGSTEWPEEVQLGGVGGMAVNVSGAGGVPAGTVYAATHVGGEGEGVARFNPDGSFREAWTFAGNPPKERCGPEGEPAHPVCKSRPEGASSEVDVDVDQATGDVYVYAGEYSGPPGFKYIHVYSPDGSVLISEFGERAASNETTAASPEKLHGPGRGAAESGGIAVDSSSGDVYVFDLNEPVIENVASRYHRLMVFRPQSPGDFAHYVYTGQGHDIRAGFEGPEAEYPTMPVVGPGGDVYVASEESVSVLDPSQPSAAPLCEFKFPTAGIDSITVNHENGEVFFDTEKDRKIHELSPCNGKGEFAEAGVVGFLPKRRRVTGLAFNPARSFGPGRPPGVLYAGALSGEGGKSETLGGVIKVESALGYVFSRPVEAPPVVVSESVARVTASTAELGAQINPEGPATRYVFQYLTEAAYDENAPSERFAGASEAPLGGALLGEGSQALSAAVSLSGLSSDTSYRYRVVATSECAPGEPGKVCEGVGAAQGFRTFPAQAPGLPDSRAYELVSPVDKHGGEVLPAAPHSSSCAPVPCKPLGNGSAFPMQAAPDGEAIVYEGGAFSSGEGGVLENQYIARRDAGSGWRTTNLTPSSLFTRVGQGYEAFDTGLGHGLIFQASPALSPEAPLEYQNLYTQPVADPGTLGVVLSSAPEHRPASGTGRFELRFAGASADLSRVVFEANDSLTGPGAFAPEAVDGGPTKFNLYEWSGGQLQLVNVKPGNTETEAGVAVGSSSPSAHAVSADGSRVFWSSQTGQVYVRENGERTREVPDHTGRFLSASADGSKVLLDDGHIYDLASETSVDLTNGEGGFQGLLGQSDDLSHAYFVDTAVLDETSDEHGEVAKAGQDNLYAWHEGGGVRFVATLRAQDNTGNGDRIGNDWSALPSARTAEASPGGGWVAFVSTARLTGYDNTGPCEEDSGTGKFKQVPCPEAFLYDAATGRLVCASCDPSGARPLGWSILRLIEGGRYLPQPRYLSDTGRLFFDSEDSLVPADTNGKVEDVYEYEPGGAGTCTRQDGCVALISAGTGNADSNFLASDASGRNVFFTSRDRLVASDRDELIDLYDAREGGGFATASEPGECSGEGCQGSSLSPPLEPAPGSFAFTGAGNLLVAPTPPPGTTVTKPTARALTRAQKLSKALAACRRKRGKRRVSCERTARGKYGASAKRSVAVNNRKSGGR